MSLLVPAGPISGAAEDEAASDLKAQADRWIDLEKRIADERNEWRTDKEILQTSVEVLKTEQSALQTKLEANELATSLFKTRLEQTEAQMAEHQAAHAALRTGTAELERRIQVLATRLPPPLTEKVGAMVEKLKASAEESVLSPAERTQTIVSILSSIDLFNNTLTLTHELRQRPTGETIDVKVLYWGLAMAYAVDASASQAWLVTPGADGWTWHDQSGNASRIKFLIDTYEKQRSPELVDLPVNMKGGAL
ncbi:MAG: DUF3450 family protein [Opitutaceae bacterium]